MATKEDLNKVQVPKLFLDQANVAYFKRHGELLTKEKIAEQALIFFGKFYETIEVAELKLSHKK